MKWWPALDVTASPEGADDLVMAALDDFAPTALEEHDGGLRVFFATAERRDAAQRMLGDRQIPTTALDVSDEDWAVRSQRSLTPITVGRITIFPTVPISGAEVPASALSASAISLVIEPSMGFGTGHHATTRLCLEALQSNDVTQKFVLDIGTGSGILALAAARLGAARAHGIDFDEDAIQSANENVILNPEARDVTFTTMELEQAALAPADIVLANLTGAVLARAADRLLASTKPGGLLIVSGILASEEDEVRRAFPGATLRHRAQEDEWVCLTMSHG